MPDEQTPVVIERRRDAGSTRLWLANPGNVITLILFALTVGSAIYNFASSGAVRIAKLRSIAEQHSAQIHELAGKLDRAIERLNEQLLVSERRVGEAADLLRRVERLEGLEEKRAEKKMARESHVP